MYTGIDKKNVNKLIRTMGIRGTAMQGGWDDLQ